MAISFGVVFTTMVVIMDPFGNVPIFLSVTRHLTNQARARAAFVAVLTAAVVIAVFAAVGRQVLGYLDVSVPALQGAGGLLLLLVALELLTSSDDEVEPAADGDHVAVAMVPLGTPLLAGPGAIVATIVFFGDAHSAGDRLVIAAAIGVVLVAVYLGLRFASFLHRILGRSGILFVSRIAGLLLAAISVEMIATSVLAFARTM